MCFALGFWFDESYDDPGWSIEFVTNDFDEAVENYGDALEDAADGNYLWYGAKLMILVRTPEGDEWQQLLEPAEETR